MSGALIRAMDSWASFSANAVHPVAEDVFAGPTGGAAFDFALLIDQHQLGNAADTVSPAHLAVLVVYRLKSNSVRVQVIARFIEPTQADGHNGNSLGSE